MEIELAEVQDFLARHAPFESLGGEALSRLVPHIEIEYFRRDSRILTIGEANRSLYLVRRGAVELKDAEGTLVARLGEGEPFGYPSLLTGSSVVYGATALEDSLVYLLPADTFHSLRREHKGFDRYFSLAHAERIQSALTSLPNLGGGVTFLTTQAKDMVKRVPLALPSQATIREAAQLMADERVSSLLITEGGTLVGIITDRDLRTKVVAQGRPTDDALETIMTRKVRTVQGKAYAFEVLLEMTRHNVHHMPVIEGDTLIGLVTTTDLMRLQTANPVYMVSDIYRQTTVEGLATVSKRLGQLFLNLIHADATAYDIAHVMTAVADAITIRLLELAEAKFGKPRVPYVWLVFGSQARSEQSIHSDQDNAILYSDEATPEDEQYFAELARFVSDGLNACGYRYCPGDVMATNPQWRQPLAVWQGYFDSWIHKPEPKALMHASIFFDLRPLYGALELARDLQTDILKATHDNSLFVAHMARNALEHEPPLGFFRQFVLARGGEHDKTFDLKHRGIVPITDLARVYSLAAGLSQVNTQDRLAALAEAKGLSQEGAANLRDALGLIAFIRLRHQARQLEKDESPDNHVAPESLSPFERQTLKDAFNIVSTMQASMTSRYQTSRLG